MTDSPALAQAVGVAFGLLAASVAAAVFVRLVRRFRAASPPLRRVIGPVYFFTLIALVGLVTAESRVDVRRGRRASRSSSRRSRRSR